MLTSPSNFLASFLLGWGVTTGAGLASYPLDTIRRRMMMTSGAKVHYKSMFDAASQIIAAEGVKSLFKGAGANILRGVAGAGVLSRPYHVEQLREVAEESWKTSSSTLVSSLKSGGQVSDSEFTSAFQPTFSPSVPGIRAWAPPPVWSLQPPCSSIYRPEYIADIHSLRQAPGDHVREGLQVSALSVLTVIPIKAVHTHPPVRPCVGVMPEWLRVKTKRSRLRRRDRGGVGAQCLIAERAH